MYHTHENVLMILFTAEQINLHIFQYDMKYLVNQCTLRCSSIWSIRAWKKSKASCCSLMLTVWPQSLNTFQKRSGSWYWSLLSSKCPNTCWIWKNTLKNNKLSNINFGHIWIHRLKDLYMIRGFGFYHFQKSHYFLSPNFKHLYKEDRWWPLTFPRPAYPPLSPEPPREFPAPCTAAGWPSSCNRWHHRS